MTAPPLEREERPPRRLIILLAALVVLLLMGCLGGVTFFVYVCLGPWGPGALTTKIAPAPGVTTRPE
jgi:hypothetical protein